MGQKSQKWTLVEFPVWQGWNLKLQSQKMSTYDCKSNIGGWWRLKWTLEDRPSAHPLTISQLLSLESPSNCTALTTKLPRLFCVSVQSILPFFPFSLVSCLTVISPFSLSVELHGNQSLFSMSSFASELTMPACSAVNNVSSVRCHGIDALNKS